MADQVNVLNYFLVQYYFGQLFMINRRCCLSQPHHQTSLSRHSILSFAFSVILNFLEIKYEGKTESPFETHPKTMLVAVASVIIYCFSYDAKLRLISSSTDHHLSSLNNSYVVCVVHISTEFFGPLSLASLSSVLFSEGLCPFFLFSVSISFSLCELPCSKLFGILWNWVQQQVMIRVMNSRPADELVQQGRQGGRRRRRLNELREQVNILPV